MSQYGSVKYSDIFLARKPVNLLHSWHLCAVSVVSVSDRELTDIKQKQNRK